MSDKPGHPAEIVNNWLKKRITNLLPCSCLLCACDNELLICQPCRSQFFNGTLSRCPCCATALTAPPDLSVSLTNMTTGDHIFHCEKCLQLPPAFDATIVACDYIAPLDQLVLALKFGHRLAVAPVLAKLLAEEILKTSALPELLIAVPLSRKRLAERGFNQSLEIAKPLSEQLALPLYPHLLQRIRHTEAQTNLHPNQRGLNICNAFPQTPAMQIK